MRVTLTTGEDGRSVIGISEFWFCGDEGDKTIFTAKGSTKITSCAGSDCVSPITYLAQGSLSLPVPITPAQPSPPSGYDASTCADVGEKQWAITAGAYLSLVKGFNHTVTNSIRRSGVQELHKGPVQTVVHS